MLDRSEDIQTTGQRHPFLVNWKVGFTSEGKILALRADLYANAGYSLDISGGVVDRALAHVENCLYIPNVKIRGRCCKTHTVSNTAFRGFGAPQARIHEPFDAMKLTCRVNSREWPWLSIMLKLSLTSLAWISITFVKFVCILIYNWRVFNYLIQINLYEEGEKTPYHQKVCSSYQRNFIKFNGKQVLDWHIPRLLADCRASSDYTRRRMEVDRYNEVNTQMDSILAASTQHSL